MNPDDTRSEALPRFWAARLLATQQRPYLGSALFSLEPVFRPGVVTAAVDAGWRLYLDPRAVARWSPSELSAVLLHEIEHLLRDHHGRARSLGVTARTRRLWNLAADAAINDDLVEDGLPLPSPVTPALLGLDPGGLEEAYYEALNAAGAPSHYTSDCGSGVDGASREWDEGDDRVPHVDASGADRIRRRVIAAIERQEQDGPGMVPGGLLRWARAVGSPAIDWRHALQTSLRAASATARGLGDPTWSRPPRRPPLDRILLMPAYRRPQLIVAVVLDTSGSMEEILGLALAELDGILRALAARVTVICCDVLAADAQRVRAAGQVRLEGGGGTDLRAGFVAAHRVRPRVDVVVVISDGETPWPTRLPRHPRHLAVILGGRAPAVPGLRTIRIPPIRSGTGRN